MAKAASAGAGESAHSGTATEERVPKAGPDERGETPSFHDIVDRYETPLLRYLRRLADPDEAEDLAQEAFMRLHAELARAGAEPVRNVAGWLFKTAHNLALDSRRRRRTRETLKERAARELTRDLPGEGDENSPEGLAAVIRRAACEKALEELAKLQPVQRRVLLLKVIQDFKIREIAEISGMTPGNAAYHLNAGLGELARRLKAAGVM